MSTVVALPSGPRSPKAWQVARYQLDPIGYVEACAARYGPVFTLRMHLLGTFVAAVEPQDIHTILTAVPERFPGGADASPLTPLMGESAMMFATGATHRRQRQTLLPAFRGILDERWSVEMASIADAALGRVPTGEPVAMLPIMRRIALEVVCRLAFGPVEPQRFARLRDEVGRAYDARLVLMLLWPTLWSRGGRLNPGGALKRRRDEVNRLILEQIALRRAEPYREDRRDALSLLVAAHDEHGAPLSDAEVRDQLVGLVLAGHETTASALAWTLERLSRTPRALERLTAELAEGRTAYLGAVIRETLRVRPSFMDAPRTTTTEIELGGRRVAPGTLVSAMFAVAHRRADLWEDPLAFRPERFLDGRPDPRAFTPFGGGARHCIAASFATLLARIVVQAVLRRATLAPAPGREETLRLAGITLVPSHGARVVLRDHSARSSSISAGRVASQLG